jgi:hypothetical protein
MLQNDTYPSETARFVRYVAYNPAGGLLSLSTQLSGVDNAHLNAVAERWEAWEDNVPGTLYPGGHCYDNPGGVCGYTGNPCPTNTTIYFPSGGNGCSPFPRSGTNPEANIDPWYLSTFAYQVGSGSESAAPPSSNGGIIVPGATGGLTGRAAIYLAASSVASAAAALTWDSSATRYQYLYGTYDNGAGPSGSCGCDPTTGVCAGDWTCTNYSSNWFKYLGMADSKVYGSIAFSTSSLSGTTAIGSAGATSPSIVFSRNIAH